VKIIFVGDLRPHARAYQRKIALEDLGHSVYAFSSVSIDIKTSSRPLVLLDRILSRIGFPLDHTGVNKWLQKSTRQLDADLLWVEKGNQLWPWTLQAVRQTAPQMRIASYSEDDMFLHHNRSYFYTWGLPHYDVVFTTKSHNCENGELAALGAKCVVFVDKAFDQTLHRPIPVTETDKEHLGADVGFIGTFEEDRAQKMLFLAQNDVPVRIWGNGWSSWVNVHPNLKVENRPLYGEDYVRAICATKINLCFLRKLNRDLQTDRSVEIPACGGFMLAERTDEHRRLFHENEEAVYFDTDDLSDLLNKAQYFREHEETRLAIAAAGRNRCLVCGYSHHDRLQFMVDRLRYR